MPDDQGPKPVAIYTNKRIRRTVAMGFTDDRRMTWERSTHEIDARVFVHEDDHTLNLQIELAGDRALLVSMRKDRREPMTLTFWHGSGEHELDERGWWELAELFED
jgi:hypothetical protein